MRNPMLVLISLVVAFGCSSPTDGGNPPPPPPPPTPYLDRTPQTEFQAPGSYSLNVTGGNFSTCEVSGGSEPLKVSGNCVSNTLNLNVEATKVGEAVVTVKLTNSQGGQQSYNWTLRSVKGADPSGTPVLPAASSTGQLVSLLLSTIQRESNCAVTITSLGTHGPQVEAFNQNAPCPDMVWVRVGNRINLPSWQLTVNVKADGLLPENTPLAWSGVIQQQVAPQVPDSIVVQYPKDTLRIIVKPGEVPVIPDPNGVSYVVWFKSNAGVFVDPELSQGYFGSEMSIGCLYPQEGNIPIPGIESANLAGFRRSSGTIDPDGHEYCLAVKKQDGTYTTPWRFILRTYDVPTLTQPQASRTAASTMGRGFESPYN